MCHSKKYELILILLLFILLKKLNIICYDIKVQNIIAYDFNENQNNLIKNLLFVIDISVIKRTDTRLNTNKLKVLGGLLSGYKINKMKGISK